MQGAAPASDGSSAGASAAAEYDESAVHGRLLAGGHCRERRPGDISRSWYNPRQSWGCDDDGWMGVVAAVAVVAAIAYMVAEIAGRFARGALVGILHREHAGAAISPSVRRPIRIVRAAVFLAVAAALLLPALDLLGVGPRVGVTSATLGEWFFAIGPQDCRSSPSSPTWWFGSSRRPRAASRRSSPGRKRPTWSSG